VPREDAIRLVASVVEVLSERLCRVELSNGHRLLAHVSGRGRLGQTPGLTMVQPGSRLQIELSPFDFSKGRIISEERN
jgi:translation initiation factor IF-1